MADVFLDEDVYPSLTVYPPVVETVTLKAQLVLMPASVYNCKYLGPYSSVSTDTVQ